jgi:hypothetical protein
VSEPEYGRTYRVFLPSDVSGRRSCPYCAQWSEAGHDESCPWVTELAAMHAELEALRRVEEKARWLVHHSKGAVEEAKAERAIDDALAALDELRRGGK